MFEVEIEVQQVTLRPGETLEGTVKLNGPGDALVHLSFQGEEILGAGDLSYKVLPFYEWSQPLDCPSGQAPFSLLLPPELPPSYHSPDLRCHYTLKARRLVPGLGLLGFRRQAIHRLPIPILAPLQELELQPRRLLVSSGAYELEVHLDQVLLEPGQSLSGHLELRQLAEGPPPRRLGFRLAAVEESTTQAFAHRKVVSLLSHELSPDEELTYPFQGVFELPLDPDAPDSGTWHTFRVHHGFRASLVTQDHQEFRESLPISVCRFPF